MPTAFNASEALNQLQEGNIRYTKGENTTFGNATLRQETTGGQSPKAYVLSCIDSRVPVEQVFDQAIGDIFVGRVAGNVVNADQLGSIEYAVCVLRVPLLIIMGHESCGAVKGACDGVKLGNLTSLLEKIEPAVKSVDSSTPVTPEQLTEIIKANVANMIEVVRDQSPELKAKEAAEQLKIVGAYYELGSGRVEMI